LIFIALSVASLRLIAEANVAGDTPIHNIHIKKLLNAKDIHYIGRNLFVNQRAGIRAREKGARAKSRMNQRRMSQKLTSQS
jgi:hypothetical protein